MKSLKEHLELLEKDQWDENGQYLGNTTATPHKKKILKSHSKTYPKKSKPKLSDQSSSNDLASTLWNKIVYGDKSKPLPEKKTPPKQVKEKPQKPDAFQAPRSGMSARDKARQMGLEYYGFGYWGRNDKVLYHTEGGELKPVDSKHYVVTNQKTHIHTKKPKDKSWERRTVPSTTAYDQFFHHAAQLAKGLSKNEKMALDEYISSSSGINQQLADGNNPEGWNDWSREIKHLDAIMAKSKLPEEVTVYRGIPSQSLVRKMMVELNKTNFIHVPTFMSTSFSPDAAASFQTNNNLMIIKVPKGSHALPVHYKGSSYRSEYEVILPRDSVLKLVRVEKRQPKYGAKGEGSNYRFIFELQ